MKRSNALLMLQFPVIFDTSEAVQVLRGFGDPNSKLRDLVRGGYIVRIKRGLYAVAPGFRRGTSLEVLQPRLLAVLCLPGVGAGLSQPYPGGSKAGDLCRHEEFSVIKSKKVSHSRGDLHVPVYPGPSLPQGSGVLRGLLR